MFGTRDEFRYFECSECGCLQISEIPTDLTKYYPSEYYSFTQKMPNPLITNLIKARNNHLLFNKSILGRFVNERYPNEGITALSKLKLTKDTKILDVGCGSGSLLYGLKQTGFKNVAGIDKYIPHDLRYKNGLVVEKKEITEVKEKHDIIMFNQSFEHISNQLNILLATSKLLEQNGTCLINMPTTSSLAWKHYRENWVQLDAPRHLYLHSIKSIKLLAQKANLNLNNTFYNSTAFQFIGSEHYIKNIPLCSGNKLFSKSQIKDFSRRAEELNGTNQGDSAVFYFNKDKEK
jgi:hypothetical protein